MKERHPIISALEHQIRIQHEIISKNDFSRSIKIYQNEKNINQSYIYGKIHETSEKTALKSIRNMMNSKLTVTRNKSRV